MAYKPPYTVTSKMINIISAIMKQIGRLTSNSGLDNKPQLRRTNKINSIYSSLAIENNALTKNQVRDIINGKLVIGPRRDILEVQNAIKVYDNFLEIKPFTESDLLKYHRIMMESLVEDAGRYRLGQEGVFEGDKVIHLAPPADRVPSLMSDLFDYLNNCEENLFIKSSVFHYEFEFIHPFSDGNGRMGRLWQTCLLASDEEIFSYLPIESIIKERQQQYYDSIALSTTVGNSNIFIEFILDSILETVNRIVEEAGKQGHYQSVQVKKLLQVMNEDYPYTLRELLDLLEMKSRVSFKKNYLDPAINTGLVQMTLPETPSSRNQRYIKKQNNI
ncbi:MAG: Fic family protein [Tenericutes bacterium]|nr:Fic family protein [Mycoplasmatota bacterium]